MLGNLVNNLCALASGSSRRKEDSISKKVSEGRVSFEDALSHIYPESNAGVKTSTTMKQSTFLTPPPYEQQYQSAPNHSAPTQSAPNQLVVAEVVQSESMPGSPLISQSVVQSIFEQPVVEPARRQVSFDLSQRMTQPSSRESQSDTQEIPASHAYLYEDPVEQPSIESTLKEFNESFDQQFEQAYVATYQQPYETESIEAVSPVAEELAVTSTWQHPYEESFDALFEQQGVFAVSQSFDQAFQTSFEPSDNQSWEQNFAPPSASVEVQSVSILNSGAFQSQLSQAIIGNYTETISPKNREFLDNLTRESQEFLAGQNRRNTGELPTTVATQMMKLVDKVFAILDPYVVELNTSFRATDLSVTSTPPSMVTESFDESFRRPAIKVSSYRARVSTSRLSLVIRGKEGRIDFYILPVNQVIGLSKTEDMHLPLMTFTAEAKHGEICWEVEGKELSSDRLERFTLHSFEHLIELTREEILQTKNQTYAAAY